FESNMMRLRVTSAVPVSFLELYLRGEFGRKRLTKNCKHAVNQASINQDDVAATPVPLPSSAEQALIVEIVSRELSRVGSESLDTAGFNNKSQALRQSVLKAAFAGNLVSHDSQ